MRNYTKGKKNYTFTEWKIKDGVYTAVYAEVKLSFDVVVDSRALDIVDAKVGSNYAVIDMGGRIVRSGIVSNGSQRVEVSKSGSYMVRVGREAMQVNVK